MTTHALKLGCSIERPRMACGKYHDELPEDDFVGFTVSVDCPGCMRASGITVRMATIGPANVGSLGEELP